MIRSMLANFLLFSWGVQEINMLTKSKMAIFFIAFSFFLYKSINFVWNIKEKSVTFV